MAAELKITIEDDGAQPAPSPPTSSPPRGGGDYDREPRPSTRGPLPVPVWNPQTRRFDLTPPDQAARRSSRYNPGTGDFDAAPPPPNPPPPPPPPNPNPPKAPRKPKRPAIDPNRARPATPHQAARARNKTARAAERRRAQAERTQAQARAAQERRQARAAQQAQAASQARQQRNATYAAAAMQGARGVAGGQAGAAQAAGGSIGATAGTVAGAAAGGPVGAAIGGIVGGMLGEKIGAQIDDPLQTVTKAMRAAAAATRFAGDQMQRLAANDGIGMFAKATEGAADVMERVPIVGKSLAEEFRLMGTVVKTARDVLGAFNDRARELARYNGQTASAVALQDVAFIKQDIREAQRMGNSNAAVVNALTKLEVTVREFLLPIKDAVADKIPTGIDLVLDVGVAGLKTIEFAMPPLVMGAGRLSDEVTRIRREVEARLAVGAGVDLVTDWLKGVDALMAPAPAVVPGGAAGPAGVVLGAP